MIKKICSVFLAVLFSMNVNSQQLLGICGTSAHDNYLIKQRMMENREEWKNKILQRGGAPIYVPVTYWLVARDDGSGRLPYKNVIDNLCCLNNTYSEFDVIFYLKAMKDVNNSFIYDDPSSTLGAAYINQIMLSNKNAVNIFVANIARASDPNVLAFYNPQGDYIVTNKLYVVSNCTTLAHEIGHFFSLAHTFYGWENTVYDDVTSMCTKKTPLTVSIGGGITVQVEFADRNKPGTPSNRKHCEQSADGFCDTPPDYNLGLGFQGPGCIYTGCAKDPDEVKIDPEETNLMSYFLSCIKTFSQEQKDAIIKDLLSVKRSFLRLIPYTAKSPISDQVNYISPTPSNLPLGYDNIVFDWEDVPNADFYILDIAENTGFNLNPRTFILNHSDTVLTNLKRNGNYYWRVTPYNSNSFCVVPKIINFRAPSWTVASENIENEKISSFVTQLNKSDLILTIQSAESLNTKIQILDYNGRLISNTTKELTSGKNLHSFTLSSPGLYFYRIISEDKKQNTAKFIKI